MCMFLMYLQREPNASGIQQPPRIHSPEQSVKIWEEGDCWRNNLIKVLHNHKASWVTELHSHSTQGGQHVQASTFNKLWSANRLRLYHNGQHPDSFHINQMNCGHLGATPILDGTVQSVVFNSPYFCTSTLHVVFGSRLVKQYYVYFQVWFQMTVFASFQESMAVSWRSQAHNSHITEGPVVITWLIPVHFT